MQQTTTTEESSSMADNNMADFLTFVSPICILVLFFACFFRFLFRSCECGGSPGDDVEACPPVAQENSSSSGFSRVHPCQLHPDLDAYNAFLVPRAECPPKYEDAIKLAPCSTSSGRRSIASPPPIYDVELNNDSSLTTDHPGDSNNPSTPAGTSAELPPAYTPPIPETRDRDRNRDPSLPPSPTSRVFYPILRIIPKADTQSARSQTVIDVCHVPLPGAVEERPDLPVPQNLPGSSGGDEGRRRDAHRLSVSW